MDTRFWTKEDLYANVDKLRRRLFGSADFLPVNAKQLASLYIKNLTIEEIPFSTTDICGILYKGKNTTSIALNAQRSNEMQNFDCMHELIHYFFHDIDYCQRICSDRTSFPIMQDSYLEWQANEGAAQFLMPYQDFIPRFLFTAFPQTSFMFSRPPADLARFYNVTPAVINFRINQLSYEIDQYRCGRPLSEINLLSRKKQEQQGIKPTPYLAVLDFGLDWDSVIG